MGTGYAGLPTRKRVPIASPPTANAVGAFRRGLARHKGRRFFYAHCYRRSHRLSPPGWGLRPPDPGPGRGKSPLALSGLAAVHRAYVAAGLRQATGRPPWCWSAPTTGRPGAWPGTWPPLTGGRSPSSPPGTFCFHPGAASRQWEHRRLEILARLTRGDCPVLVATVEGLLQRTLPPDVFAGHCRQLSVGQVCQLEEVADFLVQAGYTRCEQVEGVGQFALRGHPGLFLPGLDLPVRMEFWGGRDRLLGLFDPHHPDGAPPSGAAVTLLPAGGRCWPLEKRPGAGPPRSPGPGPWPRCTTPHDHPGGLPPPGPVCLFDTPGWESRPSTISGSWGRTSPSPAGAGGPHRQAPGVRPDL